MKKLPWLVALCFVPVAVLAAVVASLNTTNQLATRNAATGESVLVLNVEGSAPGAADVWTHFPDSALPEGDDVIPAVPSGQWLRSERPAGNGFNGTLTCLDDNTAHVLGLVKVGANYLLSIEQSPADPSLFPTSFTITADDATSHLLKIVLVGTNYLLEITQ